MFKEIALFNGGINNLTDSSLIADNQSTYASNSDIQHGNLVSMKEKKETTTLINGKYGYYYKANSELITSDEDRFYVEWGGFLYYSNSAGTLKRYDGVTISDIGNHAVPTIDLAATATTNTGLLYGDYWYTYTYVHDNFFESAPSGFVNINVNSTSVNVSFSDTPPATATHRKIYRSGGLNPSFNLVATLPIATTSYEDNISDFSISREELTTYNNGSVPFGLDMIVENSGVIYGVVGNKVYFSQQGQPEYWSDYNYVQIPTDITGLGVIGNGIVAFTSNSMYMISGNDISTIAISKLPFGYGCKDKRSVQNVEGRLVWVSTTDDSDVICVFDGAQVIIANKYATGFNKSTISTMAYDEFYNDTYNDYNFNIVNSASVFNKYYLFMQGRTAVVDFMDQAKVYYVTESVSSGYAKGDNFYVIENLKEYDYFSSFSSYRNINYRTKDFVDGYVTQKKSYRIVKINATGVFDVSIIVDNKEVATTTEQKTFLPHGVNGHSISFVIKSTGYANIKAIAYEYDLLKE